MANVILKKGEEYTVVNDNTNVYGSEGLEKATIYDQVPFSPKNIVLDQTLETVKLNNAIGSYKFQQKGNVLTTYDSAGNTLFTVSVGTSGTQKVNFSNGSDLVVKLETSGDNMGKITINDTVVSDKENGESLQLGGSSGSSIVNINAIGLDDSGNNSAEDALSSDVSFNIAAATSDYTYTISNFAAGDIIDFADNFGTPTVTNSDFRDGNITLSAVNGTSVATLELTGIDETGFIGDINSFNDFFGAGSLI